MSGADLRMKAELARPSFAVGERVALRLVVINQGSDNVSIAEPTADSSSLALSLRAPSGKIEVVRGGERRNPEVFDVDSPEYRVFPGEHVVREVDLLEHFAIAEPGHYVVSVEYTPEAGHTWRSPELAFDVERPSATFLDVTPNEAADSWYREVVWIERGAKGSRALLFEDDGRARAIRGARELVVLPESAEPALSASPAGSGNPARWVAWIAGGELHTLFPPDEEEKGMLLPTPVKLPADCVEPRLVRPLLAEIPPPPGVRPRCTIPVLASNTTGGKALHLYEVDRHGHVAARDVVPIAGATAGCWATAPTNTERVFAFALAAPGQVLVFGAHAPWGHPCSTPSRWFAVDADAFLLGDLRATLDGRARMGLVVRRGHTWERVVFVAPATAASGHRDAKDAEVIHRSSFTPPPGAEPVRARLDIDGALHLLYRRDKQLAYVPPDATAATWTNDRLGAHAPATARLILPINHRNVIVALDPDRGPVWEVLPRGPAQ